MHKVVLQQHLQVAAQPDVGQVNAVLVGGLVHIAGNQSALFKRFHKHTGGDQGVDRGGKAQVVPGAEVAAKSVQVFGLSEQVQLFLQGCTKLADAFFEVKLAEDGNVAG